MFYYSKFEKIKAKFTGYTPKTFNSKQEFYNYVGSYLYELYAIGGIKSKYINDNCSDWNEAYDKKSFSEEMLCEGYQLWEDISHPAIIWIGSENAGDGNPIENIYCLLDDNTKEYTLVCASGYYSSWIGDEYNSFDQVEYREVTVAQFSSVNYGV